MSEVWCVHAEVIRYEDARRVQRALESARLAEDVPDLLLLLQHPPVYTRGRRSDQSELPMGEEWYRKQGIEVCDTDRGGRVTYHGPGQLVGYPITNLRASTGGVHEFVRRLEQVMVGALEQWSIKAQVFSGLTGVWTAGAPPVPFGEIGPQGSPVLAGEPAARLPSAHADEPQAQWDGPTQARKIGAIGVHVRRGITTHGFAVNISNDLQPFEWIVPCGIAAAQATSLSRELGADQSLPAFAATVADRYQDTFSQTLRALAPVDLADRVAGATALMGDQASVTPSREISAADRPAAVMSR